MGTALSLTYYLASTILCDECEKKGLFIKLITLCCNIWLKHQRTMRRFRVSSVPSYLSIISLKRHLPLLPGLETNAKVAKRPALFFYSPSGTKEILWIGQKRLKSCHHIFTRLFVCFKISNYMQTLYITRRFFKSINKVIIVWIFGEEMWQ